MTLDSDDAILTDAVIVDVDGENDLSDVVMIDESIDVSDFITLSDDTIMLSDADMLDTGRTLAGTSWFQHTPSEFCWNPSENTNPGHSDRYLLPGTTDRTS